MQISGNSTIDIVVNSSVKPKLDLLQDHTYLANVSEITEDGKVIIQIGDNKLIADTKVPLLPGEKIFVQVKENSNNTVILQIVNNSEPQLIEKNQELLLKNHILETLDNLKLSNKEENIGISQKLIQYNLSVSTENLRKVTNSLINAGYQEFLKDADIVDKGVFLYSKGLPINSETMELADFLRGNRGQVTDKLTELEKGLAGIVQNLEKENLVTSNKDLNKVIQYSNELLTSDNTTDLPIKNTTSTIFDSIEMETQLSEANNKNTLVIENSNTSSRNDSDYKNDSNNDINHLIQLSINENEKTDKETAINNLNGDNVKNSNNVKENKTTNINTSQEVLIDNSKQNKINVNPEGEDTPIILDNKNDNLKDSKISASLQTNLEQDTNTIQDKLQQSQSNIDNDKKLLTILKNVLGDLILKIEPGQQNSERNINTIKNIANLVSDGKIDLINFITEKYKLDKESLTGFLENIAAEKELSQNSGQQHNNIIRVLQEHNNLVNQSFTELNKHFDAVKLYNSSQNNENNNFYLLPLPLDVAGKRYDNKIYFWSKGNKQSKIDPENMRIIFILDTQNLGLLKIDVSVVKRNVYAGIEVKDTAVKGKIDVYKPILEQQLAAINYGLKKLNCEVKKEDTITSRQDNFLEVKDLNTLDLRI